MSRRSDLAEKALKCSSVYNDWWPVLLGHKKQCLPSIIHCINHQPFNFPEQSMCPTHHQPVPFSLGIINRKLLKPGANGFIHSMCWRQEPQTVLLLWIVTLLWQDGFKTTAEISNRLLSPTLHWLPLNLYHDLLFNCTPCFNSGCLNQSWFVRPYRTITKSHYTLLQSDVNYLQ